MLTSEGKMSCLPESISPAVKKRKDFVFELFYLKHQVIFAMVLIKWC